MSASAASEAAPAPKKGKKGRLLIVVGVVVLGLAGGGAFFFLKSGKKEAAGKGAPHAEGSAHGGAASAEATPGVLTLEPFIVNLADADGARYIKCTMRLVLDSREAAEMVKADELSVTKIRDRMLTVLSTKTFAEVATAAGKETLRQEVQQQVDPVLRKGRIAEVYFTEFIVQ
jgi:flagellar FliL protein